MHPRDLGPELDGDFDERVDVRAPVAGGDGLHAHHPLVLHDLVDPPQHEVRVDPQALRVPLQEEAPVLARKGAVVGVEEAGLPRDAVVISRVVGARVAPLRVPRGLRILHQAVQHVAVVALELADPREAPAAVALRVGGVPELPRGPQPHRDLSDGVAQRWPHRADERARKVPIGLHGGPPRQHRHVVAPEGQALRVAHPPPVPVEDVRVLLAGVQHPLREGHGRRVPHVAPARMEAKDRLALEPRPLDHGHQLLVRRPVVLARGVAFHNAPPDVHHHPHHPRLAELPQAALNELGPHDHRPVLSIPLDQPHRIQRHHDVHGNLRARARHRVRPRSHGAHSRRLKGASRNAVSRRNAQVPVVPLPDFVQEHVLAKHISRAYPVGFRRPARHVCHPAWHLGRGVGRAEGVGRELGRFGTLADRQDRHPRRSPPLPRCSCSRYQPCHPM
mmetsp:Transcript_23996/g.75113  ORF Transcript_23996/g.75113 Transcript_23996/m.75113 type:complete len:447 (-) Transcript_23996:167-1507(-)